MAGTNSTIYPRVLLVEGEEDKRVIPELIEKNGIIWEQNKKTPIVKIRAYDGYNNLAQPKVISTELKGNGLSALGIIIDADDSPIDRWQSIRTACLKSIPNIPETLPEDGLIHPTPDGIKFGIWIILIIKCKVCWRLF